MAYQPAVDEAMMEWFLNGGQQAPMTPSVDEDWQSAQGKYLTQLSKGGNAVMDLDTMISANMLNPGAYDPITTFEPVDAPGVRQLGQMRTGGPYQKWLAAEIDAGKRPNQMLLDIQKIIADPTTHPSGDLIIGDLPTQMIQPDGPGTPYTIDPAGNPDILAIRDEIEGLHKAIATDPEHQMINGQPMSATTEDSPARKALLDAGIVSDPQATYDPYSLAPAGVTAESDQQIADSLARWTKSKDVAGQNYDAAHAGVGEAQDSMQRWLQAMKPKSPEELAAIQSAREVEAGPERRGGIAGFLDDLPGSSGIADWMNRDMGPDTSRDKIPQRGGVSDDLARIAEHPGKSIFGFLGELPGKVSKIPGMIDRSTESAAGAADRGLGNTLEERFSGNAPLFSATGSVSGTSDFRLPDALTGNQGPSPLGQLPPYLSAGGPQIPNRSVAGQPGASAGGGGGSAPRPGTSPWGGVTQQGLSGIVEKMMVEGLKQKLLAAQQTQHQRALDKNTSIQTFRDKSDANFLAKRKQAQRQAIVNQMTAQGRTPLRDEINARNALAYGMGM